ncbi:MAG: hypothetical protein ACE5LF_03750 [Alphaproteobacteria bacterium]
MSAGREQDFGPGVYFEDAGGARTLVFPFQDGNYRLADIYGIWRLGRIEGGAREGESVIVLDRGELRKLKTMADAFSFDYDEEFIEMCHELHRFAAALPDDSFRFVANF